MALVRRSRRVQRGVESAASVAELEAVDWQLRADRRRRELAAANAFPSSAGGAARAPAEHLAAAPVGVSAVPGLYTAVCAVRVLRGPQIASADVGGIDEGAPLRVLEVRRTDSGVYGRTAHPDGWVLLHTAAGGWHVRASAAAVAVAVDGRMSDVSPEPPGNGSGGQQGLVGEGPPPLEDSTEIRSDTTARR
jgi:hypothetical protein